MVSVAVLGPSMSGKTHLCVMLAGIEHDLKSVYSETCGVNYLKVDINDKPWHIWDTPAFERTGWAAEEVAFECDILIICHDGRHESNPCDLVDKFGADRCIIALTRSPFAGCNLFWVFNYFRLASNLDLSLVPVVHVTDDPTALVAAILSHPRARKGDSGGFYGRV